ncbi:MAG: hypothetical protein ACJ76D_02590 [Solirubrobacterales bacterium]
MPAALVAAAALASCSSGDNGDGTEGNVFVNRPAGISITVPDGWRASAGRLTGLLDPRERLVLTSFPIAGIARSPGCSPAGLLRQIPRSGVAALLLEYMHTGARRNLPPRPARFHLGPGIRGGFDCFSPQPFGRAHLVNFGDSGRAFQLLVAVGKTATPEMRVTAAKALDSLRIEPCDTPLPSETDPTCRRPLPH